MSDINEEPVFGPRLHLTQLGPDDIDDEFVAMYTAAGGHNRYFRQSGREFTVDELRGFCADGLDRADCYYYAVRTNGDSELVGSIRVGVIDFRNSLSDLVALIANVESRGKGWGTEAIALGNHVAFTRHRIRKLHGGILADNRASVVSYLRAGWVEEGRLSNHYLVDGKPVDWIIVSCFNPSWLNGAGAAAALPNP